MRAKQAPVRKIQPDDKYNSLDVTALINRVMVDGKKSVATTQVYKAIDLLAGKTKRDALEVFNAVLETVKPKIEVRSRRVGGAAYQVPTPVRGRRQTSLAIRWLVTAAKNRGNSEYHSFGEKLAAEMLDVLNNQGGAMKRREEVHRQADANKAFAHFRW